MEVEESIAGVADVVAVPAVHHKALLGEVALDQDLGTCRVLVLCHRVGQSDPDGFRDKGAQQLE